MLDIVILIIGFIVALTMTSKNKLVADGTAMIFIAILPLLGIMIAVAFVMSQINQLKG